MKKEDAQELINSNGNIKQFLIDAPLGFSLLENVEAAYQGWNVAERKLPNKKRFTAYLDFSPYVIHISTPLFIPADAINPADIDDNSLKLFYMTTLDLGMSLRYDISENYNDNKINLIENFDVFNNYLTTRGQPLLARVMNTLIYVRDKYGKTMDIEKYEILMSKIIDLKRHYNLKMDFKDVAWEMNI